METPAKQVNGDLDPSLKFAIAMAIAKTRRLHGLRASSATTTTTAAANGGTQAICGDNSESDANKWKRKVQFLSLVQFLYPCVCVCVSLPVAGL